MTQPKDMKRELIQEFHDKMEEAGLTNSVKTDAKTDENRSRALTPEEEESWSAIRKTGDPYS